MAKGLLMERFGVDADAAFVILRSISQHSNTKLSTLCADLVHRHSEGHLCAGRADKQHPRLGCSALGD